LRDNYKSSPHYKRIYKKKSFDDWIKALNILSEWGVFQHSDVELAFQELKVLRDKSIHFNQDTYHSLRSDAVMALKKLYTIISIQFGFACNQKTTIAGTRGAFFIKKDAETDPFVMKYYLPQCPKVGPYYTMKMDKEKGWLFFDWKNYEAKMVTDQEFAKLHTDRVPEQLAPNSLPATSKVKVQKFTLS